VSIQQSLKMSPTKGLKGDEWQVVLCEEKRDLILVRISWIILVIPQIIMNFGGAWPSQAANNYCFSERRSITVSKFLPPDYCFFKAASPEETKLRKKQEYLIS